MYSDIHRKPNPDVRKEKDLEVSLWAALSFVSQMADIS